MVIADNIGSKTGQRTKFVDFSYHLVLIIEINPHVRVVCERKFRFHSTKVITVF